MAISILDSIPDLSQFKTFTDRYFSKRYILNVNGIENNDIMLMFHSNRITLITLAPSHFFFKKSENYKVNFSIGRVDRRNNSVRGKGKKGGQLLTPKSVICKIDYSNGDSFDVSACMKGTLIEVNEQLVNRPELLKEMPDSDGFIAIILSSIAISEATKSELLDDEEYHKIISNNVSDDNKSN